MYNSLSSIKEIKVAIPLFEEWLPSHELYLAHTCKGRESEGFVDHVELVNHYFEKLCEVHGLDKVVDALIFRLLNQLLPSSDKILFAGLIKKYFVLVTHFHDFGKVNENFQADPSKMNNPHFRVIPNHPIGSNHSSLGAYLFIVKHINEHWKNDNGFTQHERIVCDLLVILLAYPIFKHHAVYLADPVGADIKFGEETKTMKKYLNVYSFVVDNRLCDNLPISIRKVYLDKFDTWIKGESFPLFALIKLSFSLLTASDYLATHEYMSEAPTNDFGVLKRERIVEFTEYLRSNGHNKQAYDALEGYCFTFPTEKSKDNLNRLRQEMAVELIQTVRKNTHKRLFYIEAPTGGGKTNLSMITLTELLIANPELNKVFYVFPFTTLITQTYKALKETLGLKDDELVEMHSKVGFYSKISEEEQKDGKYGDDKKDFIDHLFALYPITVLSHVKFFEVLKTNRKETNYLLHRLANSVVIIDEVQSYNPKLWDKMFYFISQYAEFFNIRFVLMSATLPKISDLDIGLSQKPDFVELLPNARKYILNPNFAERVTFDFELMQGKIELEELANAVIEKSQDYAKEKGSVRTIVEFIYKKSASDFQQLISDRANNGFDAILVLSGTIVEPRRRQIINQIKRSKQGENILLITTQVVEAGVDIDMDLGFKNRSLLDSDEQLAGRVNRNASKEGCKVYLFDVDEADVLYKADHRFQETKKIPIEEQQTILRDKDFKFLYEKVFSKIDKINEGNWADNFTNGYEPAVKKLRFEEVDSGFKIISQQNESVFVPLAIPIRVDGSEDEKMELVFSEHELGFLNSFKISPTAKEEIEGKEVWELYRNLVFRQIKAKNERKGFDLKAENQLRTLQGIMSKFTFSLFAHSKIIPNLESQGFLKEELGFKKVTEQALTLETPVYTLDGGLNEKAINVTDNFFL